MTRNKIVKIEEEEKIMDILIQGKHASFKITSFKSNDMTDRLKTIKQNQLSGIDFSKLNLPKQIAIYNIYVSHLNG